jgi:hypothetical protein
MRAVNPMRTRRRAIDGLRLAIACLPRATRVAMLEGIERAPIIVGAYSNGEGICPMLAAHRAGGRTSFIGFAEAWDRFAQRTTWRRRARPATERELLILRSHLEASLLEDEPAGGLAGAIAEHRALLERSSASGGRSARRVPPRTRPGDPDRSRELRRAGWAWSRLFRRYDDYAEAVTTFSHSGEPASVDAPSAV